MKASFLDTAILAANGAADLLLLRYANDAGIVVDDGKDLKTKADAASEAYILSLLSGTGVAVLSEEEVTALSLFQNLSKTEASIKGGMSWRPPQPDLNGSVWIVDPLDGTVNFSRGFEMCAVSIAYWDLGRPVLGVVHDIYSGHLYSGVVGAGATRDEKEISVSSVNEVNKAILATGFPSGRSYNSEALLRTVKYIQSFKKVRMLGSAALMLAQLAAGRFDVYEEEDIYIWDVAAGLALVEAAGGEFSLEPGNGPYKFNVRASNGFL